MKVECWNKRASKYLNENRLEKAEKALLSSLNEEYNSEALKLLGETYRVLNKTSEGIELLNKAVLTFPKDPVLWNELGMALVKQKLFDLAEASFRKALELKLNFKEARDNLQKLFKDIPDVIEVTETLIVKPDILVIDNSSVEKIPIELPVIAPITDNKVLKKEKTLEDRFYELDITKDGKQYDDFNLFWLDIETTSLDWNEGTILEIAVIVTNRNLVPLIGGEKTIVIHHSNDVLDKMVEWCKITHRSNGLIDEVKRSTITLEQAEVELLKHVGQFIPYGYSPLCGNSVWFDRMFIQNHMPLLNSFAHYRNIDVSTIKEIGKLWYPRIVDGIRKRKEHRAIGDILESIAELKYYRELFFNIDI